ncbi:hypothetical protein E0L36_22520 [Streptomyces sp. AJS327]|uniref:T3SS effector HopA1 family protein n=1 Tax=Streptomyces sp. AJS327 TaxID=2545265 RepID=UPI0015DF2D6A|nr:T3SS effector HopA1 family protein [Streptomyces sp. AJS327]MBA0053550.1 hypothetical protein [Streptomyces sp. AJS327]
MTTSIGLVAPELMSALADVTVEADGLQATVGSEELTAKTANELSRKLGSALYQQLHANMGEQDKHRQRDLRDDALESRFSDAMPHRTTVLHGELVSSDAESETLVARLDGVRVVVPRDRVEEETADRVAFRIPAPRPALSPGFFLTDGSRGRTTGAEQTLRLYFHLTGPEHAPAVWGTVLSRMEDLGIRYRTKISSSPKFYPRRDGMVVYLGPDAWHTAGEIAAAATGLPGVGETTSPFVHRIANGVGASWEPEDNRAGKRGLSFGEHRSQVVAEAMVTHALRQDTSSLESAIAEALFDADTDPLAPARNLSSPALPAIGLA